jgi:competence protein ComEA
MKQLLPLLCAAALLLRTLPAYADPTPAHASSPGASSVDTRPAPRVACPPLEDNPFDEAPARGHAPVDLNSADEAALLDLPGIGPARARAILDFRVAHGRFRSLSQLLQIRGIGRALLKQLRPLVTLVP